MLLKYNLRETARYLGYNHGAEPDEVVRKLIEEAYTELCRVITPEYVYKEYPFSAIEEGISINGFEFKSLKLRNHLKNYDSVILLGATLGQNADELINRYSDEDIAMAAIAQAVGSSLVENLCSDACDEIKKLIHGEQSCRFSPGYGDLHLSAQENFFRLVPMKEQLGISLSSGFMMTPTKTVTAFIGVKSK